MKLVEGKTTLITGAARGIGRQIAIEFAKNGSNIAFSYHSSKEKALNLVKELEDFGVKARTFQSNAANLTESELLVNSVVEEFGGIDVLINNAGITRDGLLMRMSEENWDAVIENNLKSVFNLTKASLRTFLKQRSGSIINMSSVVGISGQAGQSNYAASKAGIIGFTKSIAKEIGSRNIRCNVIAPGFIETEMTGVLDEKVKKEWISSIPLKRSGTPEDVAKATLFLASDLSSYITGQVICVDGGMLT